MDFTNLMSAEEAHGTKISQAPSSIAHTDDHLDKESGKSRKETDEEEILEEGDD